MKRILTVVGARPQFIKAAAVSRVLREEFTEILVHTGQHYDANMSQLFFDELGIPVPDYNLGVGSGSHAHQTAAMLGAIEDLLLDEKPDGVLLYGDTNSTLAAALAAVKIHIPVFHIEAGLRGYNLTVPEEVNRVLADHVSRFLFCPTQTAVENLFKENITEGVYNVGDVQCDAVLHFARRAAERTLEQIVEPLPFDRTALENGWYIATIHRPENTDDPRKVEEIIGAFNELDAPVVFSVHPRTKPLVDSLLERNAYDNVLFIDPMGYLDMLYFVQHAKKVVTDSGGLQKESYVLQTPCVTICNETEWVETLRGGYNVLARPSKVDVMEKVALVPDSSVDHADYFGDGHAAEQITRLLKEQEDRW